MVKALAFTASTRPTLWHRITLINTLPLSSQYASESHRRLLSQHHIVQSMSRKGNYWDNAVAESFFHSLKAEQLHHHNYVTRGEVGQAIFDYIEVFYNRQRLCSANDYLSPVDYEKFKQSV